MPGALLGGMRDLDFFQRCEAACTRVEAQVSLLKGESSMCTLARTVLRNMQFLHDLPMKTLNDGLKKYPFVDPLPFDELIAQMIDAVRDWLCLVTHPDWLVDVLHYIGRTGLKSRANLAVFSAREERSIRMAIRGADRQELEDVELEHFGRFLYPIPLKLRDLQDMVRPFMEVRSSHHIPDLDAIVQELIRGLLRLYYSVRAWDDALVERIEAIAEADSSSSTKERMVAILELAATMEMNAFEASYRLGKVDSEVFLLTPGEIEIICQQLPLVQEHRLVRGPPTMALAHGGFAGTSLGGGGEAPASAEGGSLTAARTEALLWWRGQQFVHSVPVSILASSMLAHLVEHAVHPDSWVVESLPRVFDRIFGVQISRKAFMCRLLPKFGGYVDSTGVEVPLGAGLTLDSNVGRAAETLLAFLRQWCDLVDALDAAPMARGQGQGARRAALPRRTSFAKRGSEWMQNAFLSDMFASGHSVADVEAMLEGEKPIPDHVLNVPQPTQRYRINDETRRRWELMTEQEYDLLETQGTTRDLGPYIHVCLDDPQSLAAAWGMSGSRPASTWCLVNPEMAAAAAAAMKSWARKVDRPSSGESRTSGQCTSSGAGEMWQDSIDENNTFMNERTAATASNALGRDMSDVIGFRLVGIPQAWESAKPPSTFARFFTGGGGEVDLAGVLAGAAALAVVSRH